MLDFKINSALCTSCGHCVDDCPSVIILINESTSLPEISPEKESRCIRCQHCLAICPEGALSILGKKPEDSIPSHLRAEERAVEALIHTRRTTRRFKNKNLPDRTLDRLLAIASQAPTGKNACLVHFTLIDSRENMLRFQSHLFEHLSQLDASGALSREESVLVRRLSRPRDGKDPIFRGAPHLIIASVPRSAPTPMADGLIALSYLELMASSMEGIGCVWAGFVMKLLEAAPGFVRELGIPEDHILSYAILLGETDLAYPRGVQKPTFPVHRVKFPD